MNGNYSLNSRLIFEIVRGLKSPSLEIKQFPRTRDLSVKRKLFRSVKNHEWNMTVTWKHFLLNPLSKKWDFLLDAIQAKFDVSVKKSWYNQAREKARAAANAKDYYCFFFNIIRVIKFEIRTLCWISTS